MQTWIRGTAAGVTAVLCLSMNGAGPAVDNAVLDSCKYPNDAAAQAAWRPMAGSAAAAVGEAKGERALRLPCNFKGTTFERASWDRAGKFDLSPYQGVELRILVKNPRPVARFNIYFQSGGGWYSGSFFPDVTGDWTTVEIGKAGLRAEGQPAGWSAVRTIRISAWRGKDEDTEFLLGGVRGFGVLGQDAAVALVRADSVSSEAQRGISEYARTVEAHLSALGIRHATVSDLDVTAEQLRAAKLVILPNNGAMPARAAGELVRYLERGGRLLAFYGLPGALRAAVKMEGGKYVQEPLSGIRFAPDALAGAPAMVGQRSRSIIEGRPVNGSSRVLAEWLDEQGKPSGHAAVLASANGIWMTHVLQRDDAANKRRMLLAMVGRLAPDVLKQSAETAIARAGRVESATTFEQAEALIARGKKDKQAAALVASARQARESARTLAKSGKYAEAVVRAGDANRDLVEAFARAQRPERGEFRAFWCHNAAGVQGMEWDEAIKRLASNGFTAIIPNMMWGGAAFYPGEVLPVARNGQTEGDQVAKCLAACRKYGLQMHVWKVNWNIGRYAPAEFTEKMKREGRLQANSKGAREPWLCPSHPENQKLEIASMVELVRKYAVDGIHFDYIRYPDSDHCFCDGCRARFSKAAGVAVQQWPRDVLNGGAYRQQWLDFRRSNITGVVKAVSGQARQVRPKIKISAAVFRNWPSDRDSVGQDWKVWCERGYLDFVCPMDYTESAGQFEVWVESQKQWAGKTPVYPGIGATSSSSTLGADQVIRQIRVSRDHKTRGFVIFNYGEREAKELLPVLGMGVTKK